MIYCYLTQKFTVDQVLMSNWVTADSDGCICFSLVLIFSSVFRFFVGFTLLLVFSWSSILLSLSL